MAVRYLILDEADEVLAPDWEPIIDRVFMGGDANLDADRHLLMFSATFSAENVAVAENYLGKDVYKVTVGRAGSSHRNIIHEMLQVDRDDKPQALANLLMSENRVQRTIIFCNSITSTDIVDDYLYRRSLPVAAIHSKKPQYERESAM